MKLDVSSILNKAGSSIPVNLTDHLGPYGEEVGISDPVTAKGVATSLGKDVHVEVHAQGSVQLVCSRCLAQFPSPFAVDCEGKFVDRPGDYGEEVEVEIFPLEGNTCSLDEMIVHEVLLGLPMKPLCREDCQGISPVCEQNLSEKTSDFHEDDKNVSPFGLKLIKALEERSKKDGRT